ncbi:uncharacterized protein BP5553_08773 [Venustampulla echinocandica]|uniref:Uncharacterized protein n=1 Tax=Venustampulla echinocandica TaxID=2656787 RepID=A0A370TF70_9HELO|nr:uncharacterized protein BP5553_08773 [Venustampulla echinocandica]RDL33334.1 hypothetical protein BP5553_08773 [Venustampulla echinocandica]
MKFNAVLLTALGVATSVFAHGPPQSAEAIARREALVARTTEAYSKCAAKLKSRAEIDRRDKNTESFVNKYLESRGLEANFDKRVDSAAACVLAPEQEEGPFYVAGELIRDDIREDQNGIDLLLDLQLINVHTCEPLKDVLVDFWSCNVTGAYGGIASQKTAGLTFLRGLAKSDENGVVQVLTKFPGWYPGRAQHIHIKAHVNYTVSDNKVVGGAVPHTGQLLFDQSILTEINVLPPYTTNTNKFTPNAQDMIIVNQANKTVGYEPFMQITQTGSRMSDGLLGKQTLVLDPEVVASPVGGGGGFPPPPSS